MSPTVSHHGTSGGGGLRRGKAVVAPMSFVGHTTAAGLQAF